MYSTVEENFEKSLILRSSWFILQFFGVGFVVPGQGMVYRFLVHVACTVDGSIVNVIFHGSWLRIQCSEFMLLASHGLCFRLRGSRLMVYVTWFIVHM
jgi:hypothetical protein